MGKKERAWMTGRAGGEGRAPLLPGFVSWSSYVGNHNHRSPGRDRDRIGLLKFK
jgi:hypothetical protein